MKAVLFRVGLYSALHFTRTIKWKSSQGFCDSTGLIKCSQLINLCFTTINMSRMNGVHLVLITILGLLHTCQCTYDCIEDCACEIRDGVVIADCTGGNYTNVPMPDPKYHGQINILYLQYNRITRLRTGDFSLFNNLKELYVQGNKIDTIEESAFDGLVKLEKLDLSKNMISSIPDTEMRRLSDNLKWFSASMNAFRRIPGGLLNVTELQYLDLSNNRFITDIPSDSLPSNLLKLDLHYTGIKNFRKHAFDGLTKLQTLLLNDNMASSSVRFEEGVFDNLISLEYVDLSRCYCKKLARNSFSTLKNLSTLLLNNCWLSQPPVLARFKTGSYGWSSGQGSELVTYHPIEHTTNAITTNPATPEPSEGIWYNPKLAILDLSNNRRMSIEPRGIRLPPSLIELRLGYTRIPSIDDDLFNETSSIQRLDLCHTKLRTIARDAFMKFRNVSEICLSGNPLDGAPRLPASLITLNLSETRIRNLTRIILAELSNVLEANIRNGEIEWLEDYAFDNMTSLRKLDLSENKIDTLQENALGIGSLAARAKRDVRAQHEFKSNVVEINLSSNLLRIIKNGAFSTHQQLQILDLQHNFMKLLIPGIFQGLKSLVTLKLNHNRIVDVNPGTFADTPNLEILHLEENSIEIIYDGTFSGMNNLKMLYLGDNKLVLIHEFNSPSLQYLDISNNNLTTFPKVWGQNLHEIKASSNSIEQLTSYSMQNNRNLQILDLSHCKMESVNYSAFISTPSLTKLDLTDNYITEFLDKEIPSLEILLMGENEIHSIENNLKSIIPKIQRLDLRYNRISNLNPAVFFGADTLTQVDLSGNNFECDCNLLPLVNWMKKNPSKVADAYSYLCDGPQEDYAMPVLDVVSGLNCNVPPPVRPYRAQVYVGIAAGVVLLVLILILLLLVIHRRSNTRRQRNENVDAMLTENDEIKVVPAAGGSCCIPRNVCCFKMNDYKRDRARRGRIVSEEQRDLMVTSPVTSPVDKEAPTSL